MASHHVHIPDSWMVDTIQGLTKEKGRWGYALHSKHDLEVGRITAADRLMGKIRCSHHCEVGWEKFPFKKNFNAAIYPTKKGFYYCEIEGGVNTGKQLAVSSSSINPI